MSADPTKTPAPTAGDDGAGSGAGTAAGTAATPAPGPSIAAHEHGTGVLIAIRIEAAVDHWVNDDTARSLGEAIVDELADPATRQHLAALYAEIDASEVTS